MNIFVMVVLAMASVAWADSMRCKDRLVNTGDNKGKVLLICGEPYYKEIIGTKSNEVSESQYKLNQKGIIIGAENSQTIQTFTEKWYYKLEEGSFARILTFEGGRLISIELGDKP